MPVDGFTESMNNTPNGAVFHRAYAQDDRGLVNEAMTILLASTMRFNSYYRKDLEDEAMAILVASAVYPQSLVPR